MWNKLKEFFAKLFGPRHETDNGIDPHTNMASPENEAKPAYTHEHPYDLAVKQMGVKEILGDKDNPDIVEYLKSCGNIGGPTKNHHDEVPWCSAFLNWLADKCGCFKTNNALASSWDKYRGKQFQLSDRIPQGAIVRIAHPNGHVTLANKSFYWTTHGMFEGLGGNQGNSVNVKEFLCSDIISIHDWLPMPGTVLAPIKSSPPPVSGKAGSTR